MEFERKNFPNKGTVEQKTARAQQFAALQWPEMMVTVFRNLKGNRKLKQARKWKFQKIFPEKHKAVSKVEKSSTATLQSCTILAELHRKST